MIISCKVCEHYWYDCKYFNAYCLLFGHLVSPEQESCSNADYVNDHYYFLRKRFEEKRSLSSFKTPCEGAEELEKQAGTA